MVQEVEGLEPELQVFPLGEIEALFSREVDAREKRFPTPWQLVLKEEPDLERVSAKVGRLLQICLEKDPKKRLQAIGDWRLLLEDGPVAAPSRPRLGIGASIVAGVLFVALGILSFLYFRERPPLKTVVRSTITLPGSMANLHSFAIFPEGRLAAIAALMNGKQQLWQRALDALQAQPMPGTDDATYPFWSPDSHYIGFFARREDAPSRLATAALADSLPLSRTLLALSSLRKIAAAHHPCLGRPGLSS
jgi:hypothetical protein